MKKKYLLILGAILMMMTCAKKYDWAPVEDDIFTAWTKKITPDNVWQKYPRPQLVRQDWLNLNGLWDYAIVDKQKDQPAVFDGKILVPFPVESALSGVKKSVNEHQRLWYRRTFKLPKKWKGKRVLLNFGAVDWEATVSVNGQQVGTHRGGYNAFCFDITEALNESGENEISIAVWDPTDTSFQPRGKQVLNPSGIWYTAVTGIWQTVWLEPVSDVYLTRLKITPNLKNETVVLEAVTNKIGSENKIEVAVKAMKQEIPYVLSRSGEKLVIPVKAPQLWSPESPFLYDIEVNLLNDQGEKIDAIKSYFGMRSVSVDKDEKGSTKIFLNGKPYFMHGPLDQGWWPDGLYTAPTDEALRYDIEATKQFGFNMVRKHVKLEPARWYYWCDKLGLLVWQDMPSGDEYIGGSDPDLIRSEESSKQFKREYKRMIDQLYFFPSIVMWVPFNEGWGQFETAQISEWTKIYDPTRLVNNVSGWTDRGAGDVHDIHSYPGPQAPALEKNRAIVLGEFGGLGLPIKGHLWRSEKNWGYRGYETAEELTASYENLIKKLYGLMDGGLSAAVYTQTSDVEIEVNGLMTYDRKTIKMDAETVKRINQGYFSPDVISEDDLFIDEANVELHSRKGGEIRYTTDGSEPTRTSKLYSKPLTFKKSTTVKAKTYWSKEKPSFTTTFTCEKGKLTAPVKSANFSSGLTLKYFEGEWEKMPDFTKLLPQARHTVEKIDLALSPKSEDFALVFDGFINIKTDGVFTFYTNSDDGSRLLVASKLVVDNDGLHGMNEVSGKIALKAGYHQIRIEFFQHLGGVGFECNYSGPKLEKQALPARVLFH